MVADARGHEIKPGDIAIYSASSGSSLTRTVVRVAEVKKKVRIDRQDHLRRRYEPDKEAVNWGGKPIWVDATSLFVVELPFVYGRLNTAEDLTDEE